MQLEAKRKKKMSIAKVLIKILVVFMKPKCISRSFSRLCASERFFSLKAALFPFR